VPLSWEIGNFRFGRQVEAGRGLSLRVPSDQGKEGKSKRRLKQKAKDKLRLINTTKRR
jgi:hypothetical protein